MGIEHGDDDHEMPDVSEIGAELRGQGVEHVGELSEADLGELTPPDTPDIDDAVQELDDEAGDRADEAGEMPDVADIGADLKEQGVEQADPISEADLGELTPPETPEVDPPPEQPNG